MDIPEHETALERAIIDYERETDGIGAIITGWVLVAEFITTEGEPQLCAYARSGMPYWRIDGLIEAAPTVMEYEWDEDFDDSD